MAASEFAVATSAETEILHDLTKEPAHNAVGALRTVPFDQAVAGMYTTEQFYALEGQTTRDAVAMFEEDITTVPMYASESLFDTLKADLGTAHLPAGQVPSRFSVVPSDAPILLSVLEKLDQEIEHRSSELPNAWGAIIVSPWQDNLRRIDMIISWDTVVVEAGEPQYNADGTPQYVYETDEETGEPVLNELGEPVVHRSIATAHIYLHEDSAYFD